MTQIFTEDGRAVGCTVLEVGPCPVVQVKNRETDGYDAVQLGFGRRKEVRVRKAEAGHASRAGLDYVPAVLAEFVPDQGASVRAWPGVDARDVRGRPEGEDQRSDEGTRVSGDGEALEFRGLEGVSRGEEDSPEARFDRTRNGPVQGHQRAQDVRADGEHESDGDESTDREDRPRAKSSARARLGPRFASHGRRHPRGLRSRETA